MTLLSMAATLDRRVRVLAPAAEGGKVRPWSELADRHRIVLLGEPGSGKSTTLEQAAQRAGTVSISVRAFLADPDRRSEAGVPLFLDALDQARSRDTADERVDGLAHRVRSGNIDRWRLACRAEDWRGRADLQTLAAQNATDDIVVVQLLSLDPDEAAAVLAAFGRSAPGAFVDRAFARGVGSFTETPLLLELLHRSVGAGDAWPETRFELFEHATARLVAEWDRDRARDRNRALATTLLAAAGTLSLLLLTQGAEALWRSNAPPPFGDEARFVTADACRIDRDVLDDLCDSAIMRGANEAFAPFHRTITEFLAGRALALAVTGRTGRAAYPLRRALALVAHTDGKAPTELRGVYAWFTAHLARCDHGTYARRLVEADPVSSLLYGDVAVFDTDTRRALLHALPSDNPFFRVAEGRDTALAALASADLEPELRTLLEAVPATNHLAVTVLDALVARAELGTLGGVLERIALDPDRPLGFRQRALDALVGAAADPELAATTLFAALEVLPITRDREQLRAQLLAVETGRPVDAAAVAQVLVAYSTTVSDGQLMRLYELQRRLAVQPSPHVLDELASRPSLPWSESGGSSSVFAVLTAVFVAAVDALPNIDAARLVTWADVIAPSAHGALEPAAANVVARWLERGVGRPFALFEALRTTREHRRGWLANDYRRVSGQAVPESVAFDLLRAADDSPDLAVTADLMHAACDVVTHQGPDRVPEVYWALCERLRGHDTLGDLYERLTRCEIESWREANAEREARTRRRNDIQRRWRLRRIERRLDQIRDGAYPRYVDDAACLYLGAEQGSGEGLDRVREVYPDPIAPVLVERWCSLARDGLGEVNARALGEAYGEDERYPSEIPAVAGLHRLIEGEGVRRDEPTPIPVLLCAFGRAHRAVRSETVRRETERAAVRLLGVTDAGRRAVAEYWGAAFEAGSRYLPGVTALEAVVGTELSEPFVPILETILQHRPDLPVEALRQSIGWLGATSGRSRLPPLARAALESPLSQEARDLWLALGMELDPVVFEAYLPGSDDADRLTAALALHAVGMFTEPLVWDDPETRTLRHALAFEHLAPHVSPDDDGRSSDASVTFAVRRHDAVRKALDVLGADAGEEAAGRVSSLLAKPALKAWASHLGHVLATQANLRRDAAFATPVASAVRDALEGGAPVSPSDLRAVVLEELEALGEDLRTAPTSPWMQFWNTNASGGLTDPPHARVENICRNHLLDRLGDRLARYAIRVAIPEAPRARGTRADMLVISGSGFSLPVEVKRHDHKALWTAASTQLQIYTSAPDADGLGIYLVLWFGRKWRRTPTHPAGLPPPTTTGELERLLVGGLSARLRSSTDVLVLDVSPAKPNRGGR